MHARPKLSLIILLIPQDYAAWLSIYRIPFNTCSQFHKSGRKSNITITSFKIQKNHQITGVYVGSWY